MQLAPEMLAVIVLGIPLACLLAAVARRLWRTHTIRCPMCDSRLRNGANGLVTCGRGHGVDIRTDAITNACAVHMFRNR